MKAQLGASMDSALEIEGAPIWDTALARAVDRMTSDEFGIPAAVLMELAGHAIAAQVIELEAEHGPIVVLAGSGNNGGDALVAARWLAESGCDVATFLVSSGDEETLSPLCKAQLRTLRACGHNISAYQPGALSRFFELKPLFIDGVFGIGLNRPLLPSSLSYQALAEAATIPGRTTVAVDIPSGANADLGGAQEVPLPADLTITFGGKKLAHVLAPARDQCGEVVLASIGFPAAASARAYAEHPPAYVVPSGRALLQHDPWASLARSANKYDRGHVLVIGGSAGKTGAPMLAALSALRCGAGWATVAMPASALATLHGEVPRELVFEPLFAGESINSIALGRFLQERRVHAVVIGPGAMHNPLTPAVVTELAAFTSLGKGLVVLDAGAVHGVLDLLTGSELDAARWLLTPHPGEWAKLGPTAPPPPLTAEALREAQGLASRLGVTMLYKHATPVVVSGVNGTPGLILTDGTFALARAGSGDLMAGAAGAHGAVGLDATPAVLRAQTVIAWAANLAAARKGEQAVLAHDILEELGQVPGLFKQGTGPQRES